MSRSDRVAAGGHDQSFFAAAWAEEAPWEIGEPQPDILACFEQGVVEGPLLDAGGGSGEHALYAAARGMEAACIDYVAEAITLGRSKARERGLNVHFACEDVFAHTPETPYGTVVDVGLFHAFSDADRLHYRDWLQEVLRPGGRLVLVCFSDVAPGTGYPRRVSERELRELFVAPWDIEELRPARYHTVLPGGARWEGAPAWLLRAVRGGD